MRRDWASDKKAFDHFFSGFPDGFLTIPFEDPASRDNVASICRGLPSSLIGDFHGFVVDPHNQILHRSLFLYYYVAASFPFSEKHFVDGLCDEDYSLGLKLDGFFHQEGETCDLSSAAASRMQLALTECSQSLHSYTPNVGDEIEEEAASMSDLDAKLVS